MTQRVMIPTKNNEGGGYVEFLYFLAKISAVVLISKFTLDTIKVYIKCKFKQDNDEEDHE